MLVTVQTNAKVRTVAGSDYAVLGSVFALASVDDTPAALGWHTVQLSD